MSRILLADDSPHAQRMGERILREEGFEVVTVTDGETALVRIPDVDPDLVMVDVLLPNKSGYEICQYVKRHPRYQHARVVLLAGLLEPVDEAEAQRVKADAILKKPFEASAVMATIKPLLEAAAADRVAEAPKKPEAAQVRRVGSILGLSLPSRAAKPAPAPAPVPAPKPTAEARPIRAERNDPDVQLIRAAVTIALDRAMPAIIDEITDRVVEALRH